MGVCCDKPRLQCNDTHFLNIPDLVTEKKLDYELDCEWKHVSVKLANLANNESISPVYRMFITGRTQEHKINPVFFITSFA